jgi:hypothetical protein
MDAHKGLANDRQAAFGQKVMHISHPAIGRVFDRNHSQRRISAPHRLECFFKGCTGQGFVVRHGLTTGLMTVSPGKALEGDFWTFRHGFLLVVENRCYTLKLVRGSM